MFPGETSTRVNFLPGPRKNYPTTNGGTAIQNVVGDVLFEWVVEGSRSLKAKQGTPCKARSPFLWQCPDALQTQPKNNNYPKQTDCTISNSPSYPPSPPQTVPCPRAPLPSGRGVHVAQVAFWKNSTGLGKVEPCGTHLFQPNR